MPKTSAILKRFIRLKAYTLKPKVKKVVLVGGTGVAAGSIAGNIASGFTAPAGLRSEARSEGTKVGTAIGASVAGAALIGPKRIKNVVFRMIRGKLRPIRVKR